MMTIDALMIVPLPIGTGQSETACRLVGYYSSLEAQSQGPGTSVPRCHRTEVGSTSVGGASQPTSLFPYSQ